MTLLGRTATDALVLAVYELHSDCIEMRYKRRDEVAQTSMPRRAREGMDRRKKENTLVMYVPLNSMYSNIYEIIDYNYSHDG